MQKLEQTDNYILEIKIVDKNGIEKVALSRKIPVLIALHGIFDPFKDTTKMILDSIDFFFRHQDEDNKQDIKNFDLDEVFKNCSKCSHNPKIPDGEYVRPRDRQKFIECVKTEHSIGGIYKPDFLLKQLDIDSCFCHCHSEKPEEIEKGIKCRCVKKCGHCL